MRVSSSPLGAVQPQRRGVRLGKCQARRKVKSACAPGAMVRLRQSAPTALRASGSGPSSPSAEKSSQKSMGEFHQRPCSQPRRYVMWALAGWRAVRAKLPLRGSAAGRSGLVMKRPARLGVPIRTADTMKTLFGDRTGRDFAYEIGEISQEKFAGVQASLEQLCPLTYQSV